MNFTEIFNKLKHLFSRGYSYIKIVRALPHSGKYAALSLVLIIIFTFITFPYDFLIKKKLYDSEGKAFRSVSMKEFDFSIIGESSAENVEIVLNSGESLFVKSMLLNPSVNPYRLFVSKRYLADFQFDGFKYSSADTDVMLNLNGNIDLVFDKIKKIPGSGEVKLILEEGKVKLKEISIPGPMGPFPLKLETVNIQNGIAEIDIVNGIARIRNFKLSGTDLNCTITGTMELAENINNSRLDLNINIDPESAALEQYRDMILAMTNNAPLVLSVRGTLGRPEIRIAGTGKTE